MQKIDIGISPADLPLLACTDRFDPEVKNKPKKLPSGILSWIAPVLSYDEDEMLATSGMDVVVMARLLSYGKPAHYSRDGIECE